MYKNLKYILILILLIIIGCNYNSMIPKKESIFAKNILEDIRKKDFDKVKPFLSSQLMNDEVNEKLLETSQYFPNSNLLNINVVGYKNVTFENTHQSVLTFEYHFTDGWAVANITLENNKDSYIINWIKIDRYNESQVKINELNFINKPFTSYIFILIVISVFIFEIFTLIVCIKTKIASKKWLWIIFILIGVCSISLNWTNGELGFQLLKLRLLSICINSSGPYSPWFINLSIPLGAIIFWLKRKLLIAGINQKINNENVEVTNDGNWTCPKCNEENKNNVYKCSKCGYTLI